MRHAVVTGFEVFGSYDENPTEVLAMLLNGTEVSGHTLHTLVFPPTVISPTNEVNCGQEIVDAVRRVRASVVISLGLSSEVRGVRIELECVNWLENEKYCTAYENRRPLCREVPPHDRRDVPMVEWDVNFLQRRLARLDIPLELSRDPGSYCCNALIFNVLRAFDRVPCRVPFIFVHVPCTQESVASLASFDYEHKTIVSLETLHTIVELLLLAYRPPLHIA